MPPDPGERRRKPTRPVIDVRPPELIDDLLKDRRRRLQPGRAGAMILIDPEQLQLLLRRHLLTAAGVDPAAAGDDPPPLLWDDGSSRLLVHLPDTAVRCQSGVVDVTLTVECDQTGRTQVVTTFVTTAPERPGGFVWATQTAPRGPRPVVQVWGDALIALSWRALVELAAEVAGAAGVDSFGRRAIAATVVASVDGLLVQPTAAPRFMKLDTRR